jgi:fructose-specific phosphotransferase system IIC component
VKRFLLFVVACVLPGLGGAVGSIAGNAVGKTGLWTGGVLGGLLASLLVAWLAAKMQWIPGEKLRATALGTAVGFLLAAAVAVNTLSSPVGPVLSTMLAGLGALVGSAWRSGQPENPNRPA